MTGNHTNTNRVTLNNETKIQLDSIDNMFEKLKVSGLSFVKDVRFS